MKKATLTLAALLAGVCAFAQTMVNFADYAQSMGGEKNAKAVVDKILKEYEGKEDITISFPTGRYDFYPYTYVRKPPYEAGININGVKGLTVEGNGSEFIFHGLMRVADVNDSKSVKFRNFTVDWDRPVLSQCTVRKVTDDYMDVIIDQEAYPYRIDDEGHLTFFGEGWELPILSFYHNIFTPDGEIAYNTWDGMISTDICKARAEQLDPDTVRFHYHQPYKPEPGSRLVFYANKDGANGFNIIRSKDTVMEDIVMHHAACFGVYGEMSENISFFDVKIVPNKDKDRVFSIYSDGYHLLNCRGTLTFRGCECRGQGDDFLNVHGRNTRLSGVSGDSAELFYAAHNKLFQPGDTVAFVSRKSGQREFLRTVRESAGGKIRFNEDVPACVDTNYVMENMTWTAGLVFEDNLVTKCNRARGILITTPRKSIVRNNVFHSAGTAILIEGDTDVWFESGACGDLTITGNVFDNCLTSGNRDGSRWQWGDAIITITPSHRPKDSDSPAYHKNIKISDNEFRVFDVPLVRACSVDGLTFKDNRIIKTYDYKPYTYYKDSFILEGCRNVIIKGNDIDPAYGTRTVKGSIMKKSDVKAKGFRKTIEN